MEFGNRPITVDDFFCCEAQPRSFRSFLFYIPREACERICRKHGPFISASDDYGRTVSTISAPKKDIYDQATEQLDGSTSHVRLDDLFRDERSVGCKVAVAMLVRLQKQKNHRQEFAEYPRNTTLGSLYSNRRNPRPKPPVRYHLAVHRIPLYEPFEGIFHIRSSALQLFRYLFYPR